MLPSELPGELQSKFTIYKRPYGDGFVLKMSKIYLFTNHAIW